MSSRSVLALVAAVVTVAAGTVAPAMAATPPPTVSFSFVGDTILGNSPRVPSDPAGYLAPVAKTLRNGGDVVFANLEGKSEEFHIADLLPRAFDARFLKKP